MTWPMVKLGDVARIVSGATPKSSVDAYWNGGIVWVCPSDLTGYKAKVISCSRRTISQEGLGSCAAQILPVGSVLLSSRAPIGYVAITGVEMATNQGFKSAIPESDILDASYLYYWLKSQRPHLEALGRGATFAEINKRAVEALKLPLPPLEEQKRIAAILDKADELRKKRRESIARLDTLTQSIFHDTFGPPRAASQPSRSLLDVCALRSGSTPSKQEPCHWEGNTPWVTPKDMKAGDIWDSQDHVNMESASGMRKFDADSVALVVRGMILAHSVPVAILRVAATVNQDMKVLVPHEPTDPVFLRAVIKAQTEEILADVKSSAHGTKRLDAEALRRIRVPQVTSQVRREFCQASNEISKLLLGQRAHLAELDRLFASLQSKAFAGEL